MSKNKIGEDSPIPKLLYLKIRRRDGFESLTALEESEFKVSIDGCIRLRALHYLITWFKCVQFAKQLVTYYNLRLSAGFCK